MEDLLIGVANGSGAATPPLDPSPSIDGRGKYTSPSVSLATRSASCTPASGAAANGGNQREIHQCIAELRVAQESLAAQQQSMDRALKTLDKCRQRLIHALLQPSVVNVDHDLLV